MIGNNKDQMHPDDMRNLVIFGVISIVLWFGYTTFILEPQKEAMKEAQRAEAQQVAARIEMGLPEIVDAVAEPLSQDKALQQTERLDLDNGEIFGSISLSGGRIDNIALHEFYDTLDKKNNVLVLSPRGTKFPRYIDYGWIASDESVSVPGAKTLWYVQGNKKLSPGYPVKLLWNNGQGLFFERQYSIDEHYLITVTQKVFNTSDEKVTLYPYGLISQTGLPPNLAATWISHEGPIGYMGDELAEISYKKLRKEGSRSYNARSGWIGISDKYWMTSLIPPQGQNVKYSFHYAGGALKKGPKDTGRYQVDFTGAALTLASGEASTSESQIYVGAKKVYMLEDYEDALNVPNLSLAVNFGWFWFLSKPFFYALHFLGQSLGNMGVAIILLTLVIRSAVFPLTNASYKSFAKMKKATPQVTALREKYGDDKQMLQKELMEMYQREGVNPMAGCLPMLLQIPIFFALYKVLFLTIEVRHAPFFGWIKDLSAPDPLSIFNLFGIIPWDPPGFLMIGVWPCLMLLGMMIQKKLNPPPQDPIQRDMANYFPFVMTFVLAQFASGLVIYWTFSAYIGLVQQMIIMRSMGVPIYLFGQSEEEEELEEAVEKGPPLHPLVDLAEEEVEDALFGDDDNGAEKPQISAPKPKKKRKKKK